MGISVRFLMGAVAAGALLAGPAAQAATVNATLAAQYFRVLDNTDADFNTTNTPNVANGSLLGPNGLPVATSPFGVNDVDPITHEITWWSPALNSHVAATGTGTIALPYSSNMYPPNSTGGNDGTAFETALFTGAFTLGSAGTVQFQLGSDDDSFIYVDGTLFGQNPGVHGVTNVTFTSPTLAAGAHSLEVFFADRQNTGAFLSLNLLSTDVVITPPPVAGVPEPVSWALMIMGFGGVGAILRRRRGSGAVPA